MKFIVTAPASFEIDVPEVTMTQWLDEENELDPVYERFWKAYRNGELKLEGDVITEIYCVDLAED